MSNRKIGAAATNWALAYVFALFAFAHLRLFLEQPRLSLVLIVVMEALLAFFLLVRKDADQTWHSWKTWLTTCGGTLAPLLLRPVDANADLLIGQSIQVVGSLLQVIAIISLNRAMGLLPAHREVKCNGLYRFVRHPLYAAYTIQLLGYLISNWSVYNLVVIVVGTCLQIMRIVNEEKLLCQYASYLVFTSRTRWRLIPLVW